MLSSPITLTSDEMAMVADSLQGAFIDPLMVDYLHDEIADMKDDLNPGVRLPEYVALSRSVYHA
ncbi:MULTISPECIES: hypothetical protein [Methylicorpusculum]|uniref:hypothetical protein n=1 Tax=Methylicorpusculum TaxID=2713642 RepID=UPI00135895E0|nr:MULTISPECIES: hypothetical protein [Methylicorpusculum]MCD2453554.1 hypothetical protein [Methylicorpusculum oleiharenae]MDO9241524.1 hypothetical protein [Methylicorpusculum sp.]MDP2177074.1 hypothetical protein [Methylicorpusculum sp.]MDP3529346.1 hypothetical protein [Methylicorpusculum sp.]MDZ4154397.1 hypothetical protein [Methylicorpusculum sp.]